MIIVLQDKKHKKEKKKSKDKDKEKEKDKDKTKGSADGSKLKIKLTGTPAGSPGRDSGAEGSSSMPAIPKIKLKLSDGTVRKLGEEE